MRNFGIVALCAALGGCVSTGETAASIAMTASRALWECASTLSHGFFALGSGEVDGRATVRMMRSRIRERPEFTCGLSL
jgi:hypothetical protein